MAAKTATKYDGLLTNRKAPAQAEPVSSSTEQPASGTEKPAPARPTKRLAKSKDPSKAPYTLILDIDTHTDAKALLKKLRMGGDLSDLTQRLLAGWVEEHKHKVA